MAKKDRIIIRPMYKTDPEYWKGMEVAILESTGEIIKRHFDNVGIHIPDEYKSLERVLLPYDEIDWELAGYGDNQMYKIEIRQKGRGKLVKSKKYESKETFDIWKVKHTKHYSRVYDVICFEYIGGKWKEMAH